MTPPSEEQIHQRIDTLPEDVRTAFFDEKTNSLLWQIGEKNHLSDDRIRVVARLTGYALLDFIHQEDLARELEGALHLDHRVAITIGEEITNRIIKPVLENPKTFHTPDSTEKPDSPQLVTRDPSAGLLTPAFKEQTVSAAESTPAPREEPAKASVPQPSPAPPELPTPSATSVPAFERPSAPQENLPTAETPPEPLLQPQMPTDEPTPFIIHEEEEIEPLASGKGAPLSRPHFFKSTAGESEQEKAVSARLEIGEEPQVEDVPQVGRTEKEDIRVVNYTGPELKVDPFKRPTGQILPTLPQDSPEEQSRGSSISEPNHKTDLGEIGTPPPAKEKSIEEKPTGAIPKARQTSSSETPETQEKAPELTREEPKEVSPDNIVNLKDLPR